MLDKRIFTGGLNSDDDVRVLPNGDYVTAKNIRSGITDNGSNFSIENTKGNTLISFTLPSGNNKCIGARNFDVEGIVIYFLHNDLGNHGIYQYSWVTNSIKTIVQDPSLNFDLNHKITGINLINDLLYWTDYFNEPKKINIKTALAGGYAPYNNDYSYLIKQPPLFPPDVFYSTDDKKNANYLNGFLFQFKYRYYYDDFEKSATSPISELPLPISLDASTFTDTTKNNRIDITINTGSKIVTKIELLGRIANTGSTTASISTNGVSDFFSIAVLDKKDPYGPLSDSTTHTFAFYNDGSYNNIDVTESDKLFDNVPKLSLGQDLISPTRLAQANIVEGFDPVDVVAKLDVSFPAISEKTFTVRCNKVSIRSPFCNDIDSSGNIISQAIYIPKLGDTPRFGGMGLDNAHRLQIWSNPLTHRQTIPLSGFVFYMAGTSNYGISKQYLHPGTTSLTQDPVTGLFNLNGQLTNNGSNCSLGDLGFFVTHSSLSSYVTIENLTAGNYVMRIADHGTTASDLNDSTLNYQKKSTYTFQVGGIQDYELRIQIISDPITGIDKAYVNGALTPIDPITKVIDIGETILFDLTSATNGTYTSAVSGYAIDHDTSLPVTPTVAQLESETRIELAKLSFGFLHGTSGGRGNIISGVTSLWGQSTPAIYTDHNGFFFFAATYGNSYSGEVLVESVQSGVTIINPPDLDYFFPVGPDGAGDSLNIVFPRPKLAGQFDSVRTTLTTIVKDSAGAPLQGIAAVLSHGKFSLSNPSGQISIIAYGNTAFAGERFDAVYYKTEDSTFFDSYSPVVTNNGFTPTDINYWDLIKINFGNTPNIVNTLSPYTGVYNFSNPLTLIGVIGNLFGKNATIAKLKRGGFYEYGIVYYDHANRSGTTNTNKFQSLSTAQPNGSNRTDLYGLQLYIPYYTETNPSTSLIYGGAQPQVDWSIYHEPPIWATHYQWVRTLNSANNRYLQFIANEIKYVNDSNAVVDVSIATKIRIDYNNILDYDKIHANASLVYTEIVKPTNDRVRFIRDNNGNFFQQYVDLQVLGVTPQYMFIEKTPTSPDLTGMNGLLYEVYNPKLQLTASQQIFWEIAECYEIGTDSNGIPFHKGPTGDQNTDYSNNYNGIAISTIPATGQFRSGDTYFRTRSMPFTVGGTQGFKTYVIEDASVSDFFPSQVSDIGRPNRFDPDFREVKRPTTVYYSEIYVPETKINGLSSFYDTSFETYEQKYGSIQKLYYENHYLNIFQQLKVGSIPVNISLVYDNAGGILSTNATAVVLNTIKYYEGEYGCNNPESFAVFGNAKYWVDANRLVPLRLAIDGIRPISENEGQQKTIKMHKYFTNKLGVYKKYPNAFIYGVFDKEFKNYVLAFAEIDQTVVLTSPVPPFATTTRTVKVIDAETIVFDETQNRWKSPFDYLPDFMAMSDVGIVTWNNGNLYTHNTNPVCNNFYGVQYNSQITTVSNAEPSKEKVLQALSEETPDVWSAQIATENGQLTNVLEGDFSLRENMQYAPVLRDVNTPNVVDPEINGDNMRDAAFIITLTNKLTRFTKLFAINTIFANSERSNK